MPAAGLPGQAREACRSGLVQTTAETIRPGRVQAVRLVEPLVWRAFGWCRLEVDVVRHRARSGEDSEPNGSRVTRSGTRPMMVTDAPT